MQILIVTKDGAPFRALYPLALTLGGTGHRITVIAEGLLLNQWIHETDYDPIYFDPTADSSKAFELVRPDVVIVGLSSHINREDVSQLKQTVETFQWSHSPILGEQLQDSSMANLILY